MQRSILATAMMLSMMLTAPAWAQYNDGAGSNSPSMADDGTVEVKRRSVDKKSGEVRVTTEREKVTRDTYGNVSGNHFDLAFDGAFEGQTIVVIDLYAYDDFGDPKAAVAEKGFSVYRYIKVPPEPEELEKSLKKANQLWLISSCHKQQLTDAHVEVIRAFYEAGHGLYIWGDNDPCLGEANFVAEAIFGVKMTGDLPGDQPVGVQSEPGTGSGIIADHLLSTGIETVYEGVTVATIDENDVFEPLIYGSANNLIAAYLDKDGKRAILDGGFTRLSYKWKSAGTARYIKNAAAWLANAERFGQAVTAAGVTPSTP